MLKYAKIINKKTKEVSVCDESQISHFVKVGYAEKEVEKAWDGLWYIEGHAPEKPAETLQEKLDRLEKEYQMNRWQREAILAENSDYSDFTKNRARELEDIAEQIRKG